MPEPGARGAGASRAGRIVMLFDLEPPARTLARADGARVALFSDVIDIPRCLRRLESGDGRRPHAVRTSRSSTATPRPHLSSS